ncbi:MAG: GGDEF domain-containing protein [Chromatiales bacterium]|nr:GGDEF domain-containing protein [Chromatiales bacterium]
MSQRHGLPLSVLLLDIDKFKRINDSYGHAVGDIVLRTLATTIGDCVRTTDVPARFGGEEFVVILPGTDIAGAELLANRIRAAVDALRCDVQGAAGMLQFTVSIGVATLAGETGQRLVERADEAMYAAKRAGGNRVAVS